MESWVLDWFAILNVATLALAAAVFLVKEIGRRDQFSPRLRRTIIDVRGYRLFGRGLPFWKIMQLFSTW
jgi:hypothetical protein